MEKNTGKVGESCQSGKVEKWEPWVGYPSPLPADIRPGDLPPLPTSSGGNTGNLFKPVHLRTPPFKDIWWWPLKHVRFASGRYALYWNVCLKKFSCSSWEKNWRHNRFASHFWRPRPRKGNTESVTAISSLEKGQKKLDDDCSSGSGSRNGAADNDAYTISDSEPSTKGNGAEKSTHVSPVIT